MTNRRKTALAIRIDMGEDGTQRWAVYERASGRVLAYYLAAPKRGCAGRTGFSKALSDMQIEETV